MGKPKKLEEERERTKLEEAERRSAEEENQPRRELHPKWMLDFISQRDTHLYKTFKLEADKYSATN